MSICFKLIAMSYIAVKYAFTLSFHIMGYGVDSAFNVGGRNFLKTYTMTST
jgi:hypothetical protein